MQRLIYRALVLGSLLGFLAGCGQSVPGSSSISGTVTTSTGADVAGTEVFACFGDEPGCARLGRTTITERGASASYHLGRLPQGSYRIYAIKDTTGDGGPNSGDLYGFFGRNSGAATVVSPPQANVNIEMLLFTGNTELQTLPATLRRAIAEAP